MNKVPRFTLATSVKHLAPQHLALCDHKEHHDRTYTNRCTTHLYWRRLFPCRFNTRCVDTNSKKFPNGAFWSYDCGSVRDGAGNLWSYLGAGCAAFIFRSLCGVWISIGIHTYLAGNNGCICNRCK